MVAALERAEAGKAKPAPLVANGREGAAEALYGLASAFARDESGIRLSLVYLQLALHLNADMEAPRLLLGNVLEAQQRWEEAAETYAGFEKDSPYYRAAQVGRADALSRIDRIDEASEALDALESVFPEDESVPIAIGNLMRRAERYEEARVAYDRAMEIIGETTERHWSLHYARGVSNERLGNWDEAETDLKKALEFRPDQAHVLNYLGYSWIEQNRNLAEAREMIERAVELRPNDGYITDSLGWVEYRLGDFESAVETMERAVELTPTDPVINDHFGDTLWMVGRKIEARFQWRRALSFEPEEAEVRERIKRKLSVGLDVVLDEERAAEMEGSGKAVETETTADKSKDDG
jgi:tetratricopeptide (TPR) repeat protein